MLAIYPSTIYKVTIPEIIVSQEAKQKMFQKIFLTCSGPQL